MKHASPQPNPSDFSIAVIGLGYVGLPLALALGEVFPGTVGFDLDRKRIQQLRDGIDPIQEGIGERLRRSTAKFTSQEGDLQGANFFIIAVPTPIDVNRKPDLSCLQGAAEIVGRRISADSIVVLESTVYPGVTEEFCAPIIERVSGLSRGSDFFMSYSPERINPGDIMHSLESVVKVVSGENQETLEKVAFVYRHVVKAPLHRAPSIRVAEAAKVIENTQRDLNIAFMNELAIMFDKMGIPTRDVLEAAGTKWNFLRFSPGLVGGHCIGVDPYYLTSKAEQLGYHPQVILAGRRINDDMGRWIAQQTVKRMITAGITPKGSVVGVLGLAFKENVSDLRNSRSSDIYRELKEFGVEARVCDPLVSKDEAMAEYGIVLHSWEDLGSLDALILAVSHKDFLALGTMGLFERVKRGGVFVDVKGVIDREEILPGYLYWSL